MVEKKCSITNAVLLNEIIFYINLIHVLKKDLGWLLGRFFNV